MEINFLDMGRTKYGDCLIVTEGTNTMMIDGVTPVMHNLSNDKWKKSSV